MARAANNKDGELQLAQRAHLAAPGWPVAAIHLGNVLAGLGLADEALAMAELAVQQTANTADSAELLMQAVTVAH